MKFSLSLLLLFSVIIFSCTGGQKPVVQIREIPPKLQLEDVIPVDPNIIKGKLDNGLTYYIKYNSTPENRCELRLAVNAGSILEDNDQQGLAHFIEHMAFNGTEHFHKQALVDFLESIGMRFGPEINAYTSFDETVYMLQLATDSLEILKKGIQVLGDWSARVSLDPEEVEKERGVIIEEWRLGRGADGRMRDKQFPILFEGSKYAHRLPIGQKAVLDTFHYASLKRFYTDWYRPDLMAVVAVGDFDPKKMESFIVDQFSKIPSKSNERERVIYPVPGNKETLYAIASDPEATQSTISIYYKLDEEEEKTVKDYRQMLVEGLYTNMLNQRFDELAQQSDPPFVFAYANKGRFVRSKSFYTLSAMVKDNQIPEGFKALLTEAKRVKEFGFTDSELEREKLSILRRMEKLYKEKEKMSSDGFADEYIRNFLFDEPIPGITYEYYVHEQFIPGISLDEVNALTSEWMPDSNRIVLADSPEKEGVIVPTESELETIIDDSKNIAVTPYIDNAVNEPLLTEIPQAGSVVEESSLDTLGVTEWKLQNGIRVILKPTDFKNDEIRVSAFSPGGLSLVPDSELIPGRTAVSLLLQSGLGDFTQTQLEKLLAGKAVRVSPYISSLTEGFSGNVSPEDLETLFQLVYLYFTAPRTDSTAFISFKSRLAAFFENRSADPDAVYQDTLRAIVTQHDPRYEPLNMESLDKMDLMKSLDVYQQRFADPGDFTFLFVGNFDIDKIKPLVETYLGGLADLPGNEKWADKSYRFPKGITDRAVKKGLEPKSESTIIFSGDFDWNLQTRYVARSMVDVLRIKLRERIREDLSGTYGVQVSGDFDRYPRQKYEIEISFGSDPSRVQELTNAIFSEIDSLAQFGTDETYLQKVTEAQRRQYELGLKSNSFWINNLEFRYFNDLDPAGILDYPSQVDSLTLEDIHEASKKYLNENHYVRVVLYPESQSDKQ